MYWRATMLRTLSRRRNSSSVTASIIFTSRPIGRGEKQSVEVAGHCYPGCIGNLLVLSGTFCWCIALIVRFFYLWTQCASGNNGNWWWSSVQASLLLSTEVCLLAMAAMLALVVPPLIMTWTIALVFEFIFGHMIKRVGNAVTKEETESFSYFSSMDRLMGSGTRIAREISSLNAFGAGVVTLIFVAMVYLRGYLWKL